MSVCWTSKLSASPSKARVQDPIKKLVKEVEKEAQDEGHEWVFDVETHADGGGEVTHQRFDDAEHADGLVR